MKKFILFAIVMLLSGIMTFKTYAEEIMGTPLKPVSLITNGDCSTDDVSCFFSVTDYTGLSTDYSPAQIDNGAFKVEIKANPTGIYESQFCIKANQSLPAGTRIRFKMQVKCTDSRTCPIQAHENKPGDYKNWYFLSGEFSTTAGEWVEYEWTGEVIPEADGCSIIGLMLSTEPEAATIWFKNIEWEILQVDEGILRELYTPGSDLETWIFGGGENFNKCEIEPKNTTRDDNWNYYHYFSFFQKEISGNPESVMLYTSRTSQQRYQFTKNKKYCLTFDVKGTQAIGLEIGLDRGSQIIGSYNITEEWQRVTIEFTPDVDDASSTVWLLGNYQGRLFITNVIIYDCLHEFELPKLASFDPTRAMNAIIFPAIPVGSKLQLTMNVEPSWTQLKDPYWHSDDRYIATVDNNGLVTAIQPGIAAIDFSDQGCNYEKLLIKVYEPESTPVLVSTITIAPMVVEKATVGDKIQLEATVMPENANDNTVTWSSSNESVAMVDANGLVTIVTPGTAVITATANDGSGAKGVCLINGLSGIEDVVYTSSVDKKDVYTPDGKLVMREATRNDLNMLSPGIYIIGDKKIVVR